MSSSKVPFSCSYSEATEFEWEIFAFGGPTRERVLSLGAWDTVYQGNGT